MTNLPVYQIVQMNNSTWTSIALSGILTLCNLRKGSPFGGLFSALLLALSNSVGLIRMPASLTAQQSY